MFISPATNAPLVQYHQQFDELLQDIADALLAETTMTLPSLMKGNAGVALFFSYYYLHTRQETCLQRCQELTNDALSYLEKIEMPAMFASGFPGIAWLIKHQANLGLYGPEADALLEEIDHYVYEALPAYLDNHKTDLFYGYTGLSLYFLERNTPYQSAALERVVQQLEAGAQETGTAAWWKNDKDGDINLGLAHGLAGTLKFISHLASRGLATDNLRRLLTKSATWLTRQAFQTSGISVFPNMLPANGPSPYPDSRLAWCYGDAGIALALLAAEKQAGNDTLTAFNRQLLDHLAARPVDQAFLKYDEELHCYDNCLCHGTVGITYLYFKIFLQTGHTGIYHKLQEWVTVMLENLQKMLATMKQLPARQERILNQLVCCDDHNLLHGISGAGLVLLGMQSSAARQWDPIFLLD